MSSGRSSSVDRREIEERLDRVHDPELDRSIVELQYVTAIGIDGRHVTVEFVLPTAWCSPAFAWLMATGIRDEVADLSAVEDVTVTLVDHMHGEQINRGVNAQLAFQTVFDDAEDDVEDVRRTLDHKARLSRQYEAIVELLEAGLTPEQIVTLTPRDLELREEQASIYLRDGAIGVMVSADPIAAYLDKAREVGTVTRSDDRLFSDSDGESIDPSDFESVRRRSRLANSNMSGQAAICGRLHEARNGVDAIGD